MTLPNTRYFGGALYGLGAVSIWSGWLVVARLGLHSGALTPSDITALRFGAAGTLLLPYLLSKGIALNQLGWPGLAALAMGGGAPMVLLANAGLNLAPAAHAGALYSGVVPLLVSTLAAMILGEPATRSKLLGCFFTLIGAIGIVLSAGFTFDVSLVAGDALFMASGFVWACYTIALRKARLDALHGAAIAAVSGMAFFMPVYLFTSGIHFFSAPLFDVLLQAIVQGVLTAILALLLFGRAVEILGASAAAAFSALCPAMTTLMAIPVLGEWPTLNETVAILTITTGAYIVSTVPKQGSMFASGQN